MPANGFPMKTLGVLPMGVKEKILLVEVGDKQILLGMTPQNINTLAIFDEPIIDATFKKESAFSSKLKHILDKTGLNNTAKSQSSNSTSPSTSTDEKA
jgi:flagellar protein FliO/FliZ